MVVVKDELGGSGCDVLYMLSRGPLEGLRKIKLTCSWNSHVLRLIVADNSAIRANMRPRYFQLNGGLYRACLSFKMNQPFPF